MKFNEDSKLLEIVTRAFESSKMMGVPVTPRLIVNELMDNEVRVSRFKPGETAYWIDSFHRINPVKVKDTFVGIIGNNDVRFDMAYPTEDEAVLAAHTLIVRERQEEFKRVANQYGFTLKEDRLVLALCAKTINGDTVQWIRYNPTNNALTILGDTESLDIWLSKTRSDLQVENIQHFVRQLNNLLKYRTEGSKITISELVGKGDYLAFPHGKEWMYGDTSCV